MCRLIRFAGYLSELFLSSSMASDLEESNDECVCSFTQWRILMMSVCAASLNGGF